MKQPRQEVKMKHFAFEFDQKEIPTSLEERINVLRQIGKKAKSDFQEKYARLATWFKEYNALYLLSFCLKYFMAYEDGRDEEVEKGHLEFPPHFQEILQAFALSSDQSITARPLLDQATKFKKDMREVGDAMLWKMFDIPEDITTQKDASAFHLRTEMMTHTLAVRGWAYDHQIKRVVQDLCSLINEDFNRVFGMPPIPVFKLFYTLIDKVTDKLNAHEDKLHKALTPKTYNEIFDAYEKEFSHVDKIDPKGRDKMWKHFGENLEYMQVAMVTHADLCLDKIFTFTADEIAAYSENELSIEQVILIFDKLSYQFGELKDFNTEHFVLDNPVHKKPFIKVDGDSYFSSLWSHLPHVSIRILEALVNEDKNLNSKYNEAKADYLEKETEKLFQANFPGAQIYSGSLWTDPISNKQYENDLLIVQDGFAIIVECKSGIVTQAAKRGAPDRLFKTLRGLIEEPSEQALRFIQFLKRNDQDVSLTDKNGRKFSLDKSGIRYFIPLGVTFSQLGIIGTNLKLLVEAGVTDKKVTELITSINLPDLQIIFDVLDSQAQKIHYLQKRREFEVNNQFSGDEMDLLAFYLDTGFNLGKREYEEKWFYNLVMKSKEIDPYVLNKEVGIESKKPELLMTKWWKDILSFIDLRKPQTWLNSSYVLLNFHHEEQKKFESMFKELVAQIKAGKTTHKHNWVIFSSVNPNHRFMLYAYPYAKIDTAERNAIMQDILTHDMPDGTKGALLIAINIDKEHYPYSALAAKLNSELFDSSFSEMIVS
ncbi:hypothetical protein [Lacibacter sp.]|uniref:hypothetical protein n=1 Tax=Lacibacter sp. TaxID=1915409 RepID=UPI002B4AF8DA|nr:hypothetical protein [Lacibacter sp.]HLP38941.1 hypothetical protein [Lacibacter sp.]